MVNYKNYQQLRSWLNKIKDKEIINNLSKNQTKKNRTGNIFCVVGANGYIGWAVICQLAYKFPGCEIIAIDKFIKPQDSIIKSYSLEDKLKCLSKYFNITYKLINEDITNYKTDCDYIINCTNNRTGFGNGHIISFTKLSQDIENKVTIFKIPSIIGTCNFITLIDPVLSTNNNPSIFFNNFLNKFNKGIIEKNKFIECLSLEDITRSVVKIIRKGQVEKYKEYYSSDKMLDYRRISNIINFTFRQFSYDGYISIKGDVIIPKIGNKQEFVKLIDKHRPPVEYMISYSCKNFLDMR